MSWWTRVQEAHRLVRGPLATSPQERRPRIDWQLECASPSGFRVLPRLPVASICKVSVGQEASSSSQPGQHSRKGLHLAQAKAELQGKELTTATHTPPIQRQHSKQQPAIHSRTRDPRTSQHHAGALCRTPFEKSWSMWSKGVTKCVSLKSRVAAWLEGSEGVPLSGY